MAQLRVDYKGRVALPGISNCDVVYYFNRMQEKLIIFSSSSFSEYDKFFDCSIGQWYNPANPDRVFCSLHHIGTVDKRGRFSMPKALRKLMNVHQKSLVDIVTHHNIFVIENSPARI